MTATRGTVTVTRAGHLDRHGVTDERTEQILLPAELLPENLRGRLAVVDVIVDYAAERTPDTRDTPGDLAIGPIRDAWIEGVHGRRSRLSVAACQHLAASGLAEPGDDDEFEEAE